ncbi:MAG TPA: hypothetical protein DDY31_08590 [Lachnospiraceae bacterium]|nr:hypothetical protein [Lachnospiraceae bacterium]
MKDQTIRALEYAVRMLKKEWEKSGETKKVLETDTTEIRSMLEKINDDVKMSNEAMTGAEAIPFGESIEQSKRNYILLRIGRKLVKATEKAEKKGTVYSKIELDKEEAKLLTQIMKEQG